MPIETARTANIHVLSPLPGNMFPFHPDSQNKMPAFITNGSVGKAPFALEAGLPLLQSPAVKAATSAAEDEYHLVHGDGVIGPAIVEGRPYPLALALQKLLAAREVLIGDGKLESFFTQDTAYRIMIPGEVDVTIHKPKGPEDIARLATFMHDAAQSGNAQLCSISGLARWDEATQLVEAYTGSTELGLLKRDFDVAALANRLKENGSISMGTSTFDVPGFLVDRQLVIRTVVNRYSNGAIEEPQMVAGCLQLRNEAHVETSTDSNLNMQLAGLGFFKR